MMNVTVNGTTRTLSLVDENGIDWVRDFVGNWGGFDVIVPNEDGGFDADEESFEWWEAVVQIQQELSDRIQAAKRKRGIDAVEDVLQDAESDDLETYQNQIEQALESIGA